MKESFLITPRESASVTMTLRISEELRGDLEELSIRTGHSKNELINRAISFALAHLELPEA